MFTFLCKCTLQFDRYPNHDIRPKDLLIMPSISTSALQNTQLQDFDSIKLNQSHATFKSDMITNSSGVSFGAVGGNSVINPNDYDINVHSIKNMLMTTRVPESCV